MLAGFTSNEQLRAVEATGDRFDAALWSALGETGLLSLGVPEANGGAGLGLIELSRVLVEAGNDVRVLELGETEMRTAVATSEPVIDDIVARGYPLTGQLPARSVVASGRRAQQGATLPEEPVG